MAKARRSLGRNSVSVHDTREEYSAEVTINMSVPLILQFYLPKLLRVKLFCMLCFANLSAQAICMCKQNGPKQVCLVILDYQ